MVLDPIPQCLPYIFLGLDPSPPLLHMEYTFSTICVPILYYTRMLDIFYYMCTHSLLHTNARHFLVYVYPFSTTHECSTFYYQLTHTVHIEHTLSTHFLLHAYAFSTTHKIVFRSGHCSIYSHAEHQQTNLLMLAEHQ